MTSTEPLGTHVDLQFCYINGNFAMGKFKSSLLSLLFFLACPHCHFLRCRSRHESDQGVIYKCAYLVHSLTYWLSGKIFCISNKENLRHAVKHSCYIITSRINLSTQMYLKYDMQNLPRKIWLLKDKTHNADQIRGTMHFTT